MRKIFELKSVWAALALVLIAGAAAASDNQTDTSGENQNILLVEPAQQQRGADARRSRLLDGVSE